MRNNRKTGDWRAELALAFATAVTAAAALFLAGPLIIRSDDEYVRYADPDESGWSSYAALDFTDVDSIASRGSIPSLSIRYDSRAPEILHLSLTNVMPDGSEMTDTIEVRLRDDYGRPLGRGGYGVSELRVPFGWMADVGDCRMLEVAPVEKEVAGIQSVGLLIGPQDDNEYNMSSQRKTNAI